MNQFFIKPSLFQFDSCKEFSDAFSIGAGDLIITNEYIYRPYFGSLGLKANVLYQEEYGAGEPSDEMAEAIYADIKGDYSRVIAIGGGTVIDLAKLFALRNVSPVLELFDRKLDIVKSRELILVPTTCGTGSEVTNISVLELKSRHTKLGLASPELYADTAVLIPELLESLPYKFFATSSIDALIHAVESSVSPKATPYTKLFSCKAIELIIRGYKEIADYGVEARLPILKSFLLASNFAGIAFGNAGVGAVHAMSYPFGSAFHVPHGEANYTLFIGVFRCYMSISTGGAIAELNELLTSLLRCGPEAVYDELGKILNAVLPLKSLREYGVKEEDIAVFTSNVMEKQGRLTANNFVPLEAEKIAGIYRSLL